MRSYIRKADLKWFENPQRPYPPVFRHYRNGVYCTQRLDGSPCLFHELSELVEITPEQRQIINNI